ncbi:hypothetical protein ABW20_dc0104988 [Dactylellina cionopaga]|nr:hypothetical protein ABW20_dc0104988 [Dactylellina cionopaga]
MATKAQIRDLADELKAEARKFLDTARSPLEADIPFPELIRDKVSPGLERDPEVTRENGRSGIEDVESLAGMATDMSTDGSEAEEDYTSSDESGEDESTEGSDDDEDIESESEEEVIPKKQKVKPRYSKNSHDAAAYDPEYIKTLEDLSHLLPPMPAHLTASMEKRAAEALAKCSVESSAAISARQEQKRKIEEICKTKNAFTGPPPQQVIAGKKRRVNFMTIANEKLVEGEKQFSSKSTPVMTPGKLKQKFSGKGAVPPPPYRNPQPRRDKVSILTLQAERQKRLNDMKIEGAGLKRSFEEVGLISEKTVKRWPNASPGGEKAVSDNWVSSSDGSKDSKSDKSKTTKAD